MAKRKRLVPPTTALPADDAFLGTASPPKHSLGAGQMHVSRAPIAQIASEASAQSALDELAHELTTARADGRLIQSLPLAAIRADHLVRDRLALDAAEMDSLKASLLARGQQTPIEVVAQGEGAYGLISGWRRLQAIRALHDETGDARFATIKALIKPIETVSDSYVAMVEENEIRAPLSFYERAHLACEAARLGIYPTPARAVQVLFANTTPARRSKINSFVRLHQALGAALHFPEAIPEKLGLSLVSAVEKDARFVPRLKDVLRKTPPQTAQQERAILDRALRRAPKVTALDAQSAREIAPGIRLEARRERVILTGKGVTEDLQQALIAWLAAR